MRRFVHSSSGNNSIVDITKILGLESLLWCQNVCWDVLVRLRLLLTIFMHIEFHPIYTIWLYLPVLIQINLQSMEDIKVLNRILFDEKENVFIHSHVWTKCDDYLLTRHSIHMYMTIYNITQIEYR